MRRVALWIGRGVLAVTGLGMCGIVALFVFPTGCPISRHLPATATQVDCRKSGNFPETRYEVTATMTRNDFMAFVDTVQTAMPNADWQVKTRGDWWVSAQHSSSVVILTMSWLRGKTSAKWHAM